MTGITDKMVSDAPRFSTVAPKIAALLKDRIFIAHNVNFDYSFVKAHLNEEGFELDCRKLCTVRLGRKIFPGLPSYSLGNLCPSLGIKIRDQHRAGGDTEATLALFKLMQQHDKEEHIGKSLQRNSKESFLPPNVPKEQFESLPYTPGVYYFHDRKGKIIYVGKAANIRYRVGSHFSNNSQSRQKQNFMKHVYSISYKPCGTELMACILESTEIKRLWPRFNAAQKKWEDIYGIFTFEDQNGYRRLAIDKSRKRQNPIHSFHYMVDGHAILRKMVKDFGLCPKLCFLQKDMEDCKLELREPRLREPQPTGLREPQSPEFCRGACQQKESPEAYNYRVDQAIQALKTLPSFAIMDKGLNGEDRSCILVQEGRFYGMGYLPGNAISEKLEEIRELVTTYHENSYIRNLVFSYASRFPEKVLRFPSGPLLT
jgi:DNA polymerase-3 subunit epsilon